MGSQIKPEGISTHKNVDNMIFWKYAYGNVHMIPYGKVQVYCSSFFLRFFILSLKILFLQLEVEMKFNALHNESNNKCGILEKRQ